MRQLKKRYFCKSAQWLSFLDGVCSQCIRIAVDCLTVTGQMKYDRYECVNFERERRQILKLYRGTPIIERHWALEQCVMDSLGL